MNYKDSSSMLRSTMDSFWEKFNENQNSLYFASNLMNFSHNNLHDGFRNKRKYFLLAEKPYMEEYLTKNSVNYTNKEFVTYKAKFLKNSDIGCSGSIHVLGRYFSKIWRRHLANESPRARLSTDIYSCKRNFDTFLEWDTPLVNSLEYILNSNLEVIISDNVDKYNEEELDDMIEALKRGRKDYLANVNWDELRAEFAKPNLNKSGVIVTSIPNADGENRFSSFLNNMKTHNNQNVIYTDKLFIQTKKINTFKQPYSEKMKNLNKVYKVNPQIKNLFQKNTQIIIIDDVLTSGAHFEQCLRALKDSRIEHDYNVHGLFLAATQSNNTNWESGLEYTDSRFILHTN